jgi:hypothetical protein
MRLRLLVLPAIGLATVGLAMVGLVPAGRAGTLDQARLRGSTAGLNGGFGAGFNAYDSAPSYPVTSAEPYPARVARTSYPASYPVAKAPARPVAVAPPVAPLPGFTFELGTRYWYSSGTLAKDLYDDPRSSRFLNSRLTYSGLASGTFEGFGRVNTTFGSFFKGYAGFSGLNRGSLNDEDFPPNTAPYSSTLSGQQGGKLAYGSIDFGQTIVRTDRLTASLIAGYGFLNESVNAYGCNQIAGNPFICAPAINSGVLAITEQSSWQFARVGLLGEFKVLDCLKLSAEVAWLPYDQVNAQDTHWLRLGTRQFAIAGPIPEGGGGAGVQLEAIASYRVSDHITLGLGGRYWYLQTRGNTEFEGVIVGFPAPGPQPLNFTTTRYGGFAQLGYKLGPF